MSPLEVAVAGHHNPTLKPPEAMAAEPKAFNPTDSTSPPPQPQQNKHQPTKPFLFSTIDHVAAATKQQRHQSATGSGRSKFSQLLLRHLFCCCGGGGRPEKFFGDLIFPEAAQRRARGTH
jgi:hypothetical protein